MSQRWRGALDDIASRVLTSAGAVKRGTLRPWSDLSGTVIGLSLQATACGAAAAARLKAFTRGLERDPDGSNDGTQEDFKEDSAQTPNFQPFDPPPESETIWN